MVIGIAHICLRVADLDRACDFYCGKLRMQHAFDFVKDDGQRFGCYLKAGGRNFVELFRADLAPPAEKQSFGHVCLEVDDIEAAVARLRSLGVAVTDVKLGSDHSYQAWLSDPDGNRIELHGYTPESRQLPFLE